MLGDECERARERVTARGFEVRQSSASHADDDDEAKATSALGTGVGQKVRVAAQHMIFGSSVERVPEREHWDRVRSRTAATEQSNPSVNFGLAVNDSHVFGTTDTRGARETRGDSRSSG